MANFARAIKSYFVMINTI